MDWIVLFLAAGMFSLTCLVSCGHRRLQRGLMDSPTWVTVTQDVFLCVALLVLSAVLFDIARLKPSRHHTLKSLLFHYIFIKTLPFQAFCSKRRIRVAVDHIQQMQEKLLLDIIQHNSSTKYGRIYNFNQIQGVEDFRRLQPLTYYSDYEVYINDILNGIGNVLFPEEVDFIITSSGTTSGKSKQYPICLRTKMQELQDVWIIDRHLITSSLNMNHLKFWHKVTIHPQNKNSTQSGIPQNALSSFIGSTFPFFSSPPVVYKVEKEPDALYLHALFGIRNEDVIFFQFMTTPVALNFMRIIENNWENLCTDVEHGTLNPKIDIDPSLRFQVENELHMDMERSRHLRRVFSEGFHDMIPRIWPACRYLIAVTTGSFSFATETLKRYYLGNVRLHSPVHVATEGVYGLNVDDLSTETNYTIVPSLNFYEFIPMDEMDYPVPKSVLAEEVEVGREYELVVTNRNGFYRYRTSDIVRVTGFQKQSPSYVFVQRSDDVLSANMDKYPERLFTEAVTAAAKTWTSGSLYNYIATENIHVERVTGKKSEISCYYVFIELLEEGSKLTQKEKLQIDECLKDKQERYCDHRNKRQSLNAPVVIQIENGSIQRVRDIQMQENANTVISQYKYPRFIRKQSVLQYLLNHQVE